MTAALAEAAKTFEQTLEELGITGKEREVNPSALGRRAALLAASDVVWHKHLGPLYSSKQVREVMGRGTRQSVSELAKRGLRRRIGVVAPDTFSAMTMVARTDMAALIPRRLALMSAQSGRLALIEPPYETPPVDLTLLYRKDRLAEPPIAWMRALLTEVSASV